MKQQIQVCIPTIIAIKVTEIYIYIYSGTADMEFVYSIH